MVVYEANKNEGVVEGEKGGAEGQRARLALIYGPDTREAWVS